MEGKIWPLLLLLHPGFFSLASLSCSINPGPSFGRFDRTERKGWEGRGKKEEVISLEQGLPVAFPPFLERRLGAAFPGNAPRKTKMKGAVNIMCGD